MARQFLVNDLCLYTSGAGVAIYLQNILGHWPDDSPLRPTGLRCLRFNFRRHWADAPGPSHRPLALRPLSRLTPPSDAPAPVPLRNRIRHKLFISACSMETRLRRLAAVFEPNNIPMVTGRPTVTTIHDISVLDHPEWHPQPRVDHWEQNLATALSVTAHWITDSDFTRDRMVAVLGLDPARVSVVRLAARPLPFPDRESLPRVRRELGLPQRYLLHLGTLEPRKNIVTLLDAYAALPENLRSACPLILAGIPGWGSDKFWSSLINHPVADRVLTTGYIGDHQLAPLLAGATALLSCSHYEGFGLPILEAMSCGTPVACSNIPAFREITDHSAHVVEPTDTPGWTGAMRSALEDDAWREHLTAAGPNRSREFRWDAAARQTADIIGAVAQRA